MYLPDTRLKGRARVLRRRLKKEGKAEGWFLLHRGTSSRCSTESWRWGKEKKRRGVALICFLVVAARKKGLPTCWWRTGASSTNEKEGGKRREKEGREEGEEPP